MCVDGLFLDAAPRAVVGMLALSCLDDPAQSRVGALQIPADPATSIDDNESNSPLTLGQRALLIVALHDGYCPDAEEKAFSIRSFTAGEALTDLVEFGRSTRWDEIRLRVRALGNYALDWFKRHFSRIEMHLASEVAPANEGTGNVPHSQLRPVACAEPTPEGENALCDTIYKSGKNWLLRYGDEEGSFPVKHTSGLEVVAKLVASPSSPIPLTDLVHVDPRVLIQRPGSQDGVLDHEAIQALREKLEELRIDRARNADDHLVLEDIDRETAQIAAQLSKGQAPGGRRRRISSTPAERARNALKRKLSRLWDELTEHGMPKLATHLEEAIQFNVPNVTYQRPDGTPPWNTEGPGQP
jgi:hypothetical protein